VIKSNVTEIHLWGSWVSKRLFTVTRCHLSCSSPNISCTEGTSSQIWQQQGALQVVATSLYDPLKHLSSNVHISLDHFHNFFCAFQILPGILPAKNN